MRLKRCMALGLSVIMTASVVAGCGSNSQNSKQSAENGTVSTAGENSGTDDASSQDSDDLSEYFHSKDHYTLKVMAMGDADTSALEEISARLSAITEEKLNCDVELVRIGFAAYMQQLNLMLSSGDEIDLFVPMSDPLEYVNAGQIQPIGDLVERFAPNLNSNIDGLDWAGGTYGGEIYGLPTNGIPGQVIGFGMRKDICDELGIDYENFQSWDDLHEALVKVKENYPDMYPIVSNGGDMFGGGVVYIGQDSCGDTNNLAVLEDPFDENGKIVNFFSTDLFRETCERMYQWAQEGLIMPDASTNTDSCNTLVAAGKAFGYFQHSMTPLWAADATKSNGGIETVAWEYGTPTYIGYTMTWFVPTASGDPERAVAFFDLMYSDKEVANLVINGIEGENYVLVDEANGIMNYPEGKDAATNGYSRLGWAWPNERLSYTMEGTDSDWAACDEFADSCQVPVSFGFKFDSTPVMNQTTACLNVYEKYVPALLCGSLNPDETIPQLISEMENAGINDIIEEKQAQYDTWKADQQQ